MPITILGLKGPPALAVQLQRWGSDSPDLLDATVGYVAREWLAGREASVERVRAVYLQFRRFGAAGDPHAAHVSCALERLLEQHGHLELRWRA